jgi:lipopolysaccharide transport system permease protein
MTQAGKIIIEPHKTSRGYWSEIYEYRELLFFFVWRDVLVRYKQTSIGILWAVLRPVSTMIVFTFVFGKVAGLPTEGSAPYALLVFSGILPWQLFSGAVQTGADSLISNAQMISKVYVPKLIFPMIGAATACLDFLIALGVYFVLMAYHQIMPDWRLLTLPVFILFAIIASLAISFFVSALNVFYRDFRYIIPFLLQLGFYISPIGYSVTVVPEKWRLLYSINPMVGVIDGFRWALLGQDVTFYWPGLAISSGIVFCMLWIGLKTFRSMESTFADKV